MLRHTFSRINLTMNSVSFPLVWALNVVGKAILIFSLVSKYALYIKSRKIDQKLCTQFQGLLFMLKVPTL